MTKRSFHSSLETTRFRFVLLAFIFSVSAPAYAQVINPMQAGVIENGSPISPNLTGATSIYTLGNYAYVVGSSDVLEIFDISLPGAPLHKGSLRNGEGGASILKPLGIVVSGNFAYICNSGGSSVEVVDVSDPAKPFHKTTIVHGPTPYLYLPQGISVSGNYLYLPVYGGGLMEILDISNAGAPVHKGIASLAHVPWSIAIVNNIAYVAESYGIEVIDVSNPALPVIKKTLTKGKSGVDFVTIQALTVAGNYLYAVDNYNKRIEIIDITDPSNPFGVVTIDTPNVPWSINVSGNALYVGYLGNNLDVFDISTPTAPVKKTGLSSALFGLSRSIAINGTAAYVADQNTSSMIVLDITTPTSPTIKTNVTTKLGSGGALLNDPQSVYVSGNYAYVADKGGNGLEIIDVTDPSTPSHKGSLTNGTGANFISPTSVFVSGNYAYVVGNGSLEIVDVSNPSLPSHMGSLSDGSGAVPYLSNSTSIFVLGNYAYIASSGRNALEIVNISNPSAPVHAASIQDNTNLVGAQSIYVSTISNKNYAFIACASSNRLTIVDVSNLGSLSITKTLTDGNGTPGNAPYLNEPMSVFVSGNYAYIVSRGSKALEIIDVTTPATALHKGFLKDGATSGAFPPYLNYPRSVHVSGNTAFVASGYTPNTSFVSGLEVIDVTDPAAPKHKANLNNLQQGALLDGPTSIFVAGNYAYITNSLLFTNLNVVYLYGPSITGFVPTSGAAGTSVTVTGQNFNTFVKASINGVAATITSVAATSLTLTIPTGASIGRIALSYDGQSFTSNSNFVVTPAALPASSILQTGFTANWSDVGASVYFLDVSTTNNFTSFVTGYNNRNVGKATSFNVAGLLSGTTYYYRVRSGGLSVTPSNIISTQTIPSTPVLSAATSVKQNTFTFSWSAVTSATSYYVDVATDNLFASLLGNYSNLTTAATSINVNALNPGETYYYRVRSANTSGSSPSSSLQSIITIPANPTTTDATAITTSGITANWSTVAGATEYFIDISTDNFATFVSGFANVSAGASTLFNATLSSGTSYQYRVRASNSSGKSDNSNIISVLTLTPIPTAQPSGIVFSNITASSVNVSFSKAQDNPASYLVIRSIGSAPTTPPVNGTAYVIGTPLGNASVAYVGPSLSFFDGGLPASSKYFYSVYAFNGSGVATNYKADNPLQGNVILDVDPPVLSAPPVPNPTTITSGNTPIFNVAITDNVKVASAQIYYRGISRNDFKSVPVFSSGSGTNYSVQIQANWYDSLGIEYYFMAADESGNTSVKPASSFAQIVNTSISLPALPSGPDQESYRVIAFPYQLSTDNNVSTVYSNVPWNDNTKAGLWWWNPNLKNGAGDYDQYGVSAILKTIDPGKGYWAITSSPVTPQLTNVPSPNFNKNKLFQMTLKPGWNEIGNPYPVAISWDEVIAFNQQNNVTAFSELTVYDGSGYKSAKGNVLLKPFEGGFVKNLSSSDITIQIPFKGQTSSGGRMASMSTDISQEDWNIFLHIDQSNRTNQLGGFGMHRLAQSGIDRYDNFNPPSFLNIPQVSFTNAEYPGVAFSNDMVKSQDDYTWSFTPAGSIGKTATLKWDTPIVTSSKQLLLLDEEQLKVIDMSSITQYDFILTSNSRFRIFYGSDVKITTSRIVASSPFPNPLTNDGKTTINVALPESSDDYSINMQVYNGHGGVIGSLNKRLSPGIHPLELALPVSLSEGIYIYKLAVTNEKTSSIHTGKIVKP